MRTSAIALSRLDRSTFGCETATSGAQRTKRARVVHFNRWYFFSFFSLFSFSFSFRVLVFFSFSDFSKFQKISIFLLGIVFRQPYFKFFDSSEMISA